ncbi:hypothetical protein [Leptospira santarosai]|uniref:hypothetical protein n=1 Tax=Leptospira santarosai TaxID=28183 RepID=UPI0024AF5206|nr:hypothetical protein [Leptospira santarosai]MDI7188353.1 hypothetical protein [Leptospira santarosai]
MNLKRYLQLYKDTKNKVHGTKFFSIARALIKVALLACVIYSTYCVHVIVTGLTPQPIPIYRKSETPQVYSDIFSSDGYLCAATPEGEFYDISMRDDIKVCFLRLSAKDADWIRQKFASVKPGHRVIERSFSKDLQEKYYQSWGRFDADAPILSPPCNQDWGHCIPSIPSSRSTMNAPDRFRSFLEEVEGQQDEYSITNSMVFLRLLTLRLWINRINPNDMIEYREDVDRCALFRSTYCDSYYIPLQGDFLFYVSEHHSHYM